MRPTRSVLQESLLHATTPATALRRSRAFCRGLRRHEAPILRCVDVYEVRARCLLHCSRRTPMT